MNEVIFFGSKDKSINKASVKYLENSLYDIATKANRYKISQTVPTRSELSEAEQAELEEFLSNIKLLTASLGHKLFETVDETVEIIDTKKQSFYCRNGAGANSKGSPSTEGFVIFKNALFMVAEQPSLTESISNERKRLLNEGILTSQGAFYLLTRDYNFTSSSRAASATLARSASGPLEWKNEDGVQLKQFVE